MEVNNFFSTPVFIFGDNNFQSNKDQLIEEIYAWRDEDAGELVRSNQGGWHSDTTVFRRQDPQIKRVCHLMVTTFNKCTKHIAPKFEIEKMDMKGEGWVNVNPQHSFNVPHDHPGYTWSGVYYVKVAEDDDQQKLQTERDGCIEFLDPRTSVSALATDVTKYSDYFSPKKTITPRPGLIVIFPSYLRHWVYPNKREEDRITFAFNFRYAAKANPDQLLAQAQAAAVSKQKLNKGPKKTKGKRVKKKK